LSRFLFLCVLRILFLNLFLWFITITTWSQSCKPFVLRFNTHPHQDKICSTALIEDLTELQSMLLEIHPDLYRHSPKAVLDSAYLSAVNQCRTDKTLFEFAQIINDYLMEIKDSHTFFNLRELLSYQRSATYYLPCLVSKINNQWIITKAWKNQLPVGAELLKFDGMAPEKLIEVSRGSSPIEANSWEAQQELSDHVLSTVLNLSSLKKLVSVTHRFHGDTITQVVHPPRVKKIMKSADFIGEFKNITYHKQGQKAIIKIPSFSPNSIAWFKKRLDEVFSAVMKDSIEALAIDLRDNTGGYIVLQEYLMSFLAPPGTRYVNQYVYKRSDYDRFEQLSSYQKWRFKKTALRFYPNGAIAKEWDFYNSPKGTVDTVVNDPVLSNKNNIQFKGSCSLLINGMSMSAAANFAAWFIENNRGPSLGTAPSGTFSGTFANPATVYLTNTALPVMISTMKVNSLNEALLNQPIYPSMLLTPNQSNIEHGEDVLKTYFLNN